MFPMERKTMILAALYVLLALLGKFHFIYCPPTAAVRFILIHPIGAVVRGARL